jgi:hypothetical protein
MVGPAPERQIPSRPGCEAGVIKDVTAGRPGIWNGGQDVGPTRNANYTREFFDTADVRDLS